MALVVGIAAVVIALLGVVWVKGYDFVKKHSKEHLVHFYIILATIRLLLIATLVAVWILIAQPERGEALPAAAIIMAMYALMMAITLKLRH